MISRADDKDGRRSRASLRDNELISVHKAESPASSTDVAAYISEMSGQMAQLASSANMEMLAYFLDMARIESDLILRRNRPDVTMSGLHGRTKG